MPSITEKMVMQCKGLNLCQKNCMVAAASGILFFSAWWMMIDLHATSEVVVGRGRIYYLPLVGGTLGLILISIIPTGLIKEDSYYEGKCMGRLAASILLFTGLVIVFGSFIGSLYILIHDFILEKKAEEWGGWSIFIQNACVLISSMFLKFLIKREEF